MLGKKLKELRGNLTQNDICDKLGITRATYAHYENDRRSPDYQTLLKIATYFNVSLDYLLDNEKVENKYKEINPKILKLAQEYYYKIKKLSPESQEIVERKIEKLVQDVIKTEKEQQIVEQQNKKIFELEKQVELLQSLEKNRLDV